jgi:hypothetical protein
MANPVFGEPVIVEGLANALQELRDCGAPQLLVRVYPKDRTGRFDDLKRRRQDILFPDVAWEPKWLTPLPEDSTMLTNCLRHADVGVNVASTISLELCMFEKPVINIAYNPPGLDISPWDYARFYEFEHYRPVVASGAVTIARSPSQLVQLLRHALENPSATRARQRTFLDTMFGATLDGRSGERVADCLLALAHGGKASLRPLTRSLLGRRAGDTEINVA